MGVRKHPPNHPNNNSPVTASPVSVVSIPKATSDSDHDAANMTPVPASARPYAHPHLGTRPEITLTSQWTARSEKRAEREGQAIAAKRTETETTDRPRGDEYADKGAIGIGEKWASSGNGCEFYLEFVQQKRKMGLAEREDLQLKSIAATLLPTHPAEEVDEAIAEAAAIGEPVEGLYIPPPSYLRSAGEGIALRHDRRTPNAWALMA